MHDETGHLLDWNITTPFMFNHLDYRSIKQQGFHRDSSGHESRVGRCRHELRGSNLKEAGKEVAGSWLAAALVLPAKEEAPLLSPSTAWFLRHNRTCWPLLSDSPSEAAEQSPPRSTACCQDGPHPFSTITQTINRPFPGLIGCCRQAMDQDHDCASLNSSRTIPRVSLCSTTFQYQHTTITS